METLLSGVFCRTPRQHSQWRGRSRFLRSLTDAPRLSQTLPVSLRRSPSLSDAPRLSPRLRLQRLVCRCLVCSVSSAASSRRERARSPFVLLSSLPGRRDEGVEELPRGTAALAAELPPWLHAKHIQQSSVQRQSIVPITCEYHVMGLPQPN